DHFGPQATFINVNTTDPADPPGMDWHVERVDDIIPTNLYDAFVATRRQRLAGGGAAPGGGGGGRPGCAGGSGAGGGYGGCGALPERGFYGS
ncbi:hypothetical protein MNEG_16290, partial [Monoraphidium neglectum]